MLSKKRKHDDFVLTYQRTNGDMSWCTNIVIEKSKAHCLKPAVWLNDEIVNYFMSSYAPSSAKGQVWAQSSYFFSKLMEGGKYTFKNVQRWTRHIKIFELALMLIPINIKNCHWALGICNFLTKTLEYYDSMGSAESNDFFMVFMQLHFAFSSQFNVSYGHCCTHLQLFFRQCDST